MILPSALYGGPEPHSCADFPICSFKHSPFSSLARAPVPALFHLIVFSFCFFSLTFALLFKRIKWVYTFSWVRLLSPSLLVLDPPPQFTIFTPEPTEVGGVPCTPTPYGPYALFSDFRESVYRSLCPFLTRPPPAARLDCFLSSPHSFPPPPRRLPYPDHSKLGSLFPQRPPATSDVVVEWKGPPVFPDPTGVSIPFPPLMLSDSPKCFRTFSPPLMTPRPFLNSPPRLVSPRYRGPVAQPFLSVGRTRAHPYMPPTFPSAP